MDPVTSLHITTSPISTTASTSKLMEIPTARMPIDGPHYPPKDKWDRRPVSIDFYNNYMTNFHDNAFEIDGSMHNVRVMRNMMLNSASHPFCNQPSLGGPMYWIRNIAYHAPTGSTRLTTGSAGVLFYNNTILTETTAASAGNVHWRNNLMLGRELRPGHSRASIQPRTTVPPTTTGFVQTPARKSRSSGTHRPGTRRRL